MFGTVTVMDTTASLNCSDATPDALCAEAAPSDARCGTEDLGAVVPQQRVLVAGTADLEEMLIAVADPVERARWATRLLKEFEEARLAVAEVRRVAVGQTGLGPRGLERALGISVTAAADLRRAARGAPRRSER